MKTNFTSTLLLLALLVSFNVYSLPKLNSFPSASATILLDFDGHNVTNGVWNGGAAFTCAPAQLNDAQITEVFNRVSEDYRPFNINITTDSAVYLAAPLTKRMRVVITPTSGWFQNVGGVSYVGSFKWGDETPAFVFSDRLGNNAKMVAECCSHESGHTVGLSHQSKYDGDCRLTATYNDGIGSGENSWAPIMGNSYYRNMSGWNNGPTPYGCANTQDNLSIITTQNGFTYRPDDHTDNLNGTPTQISTTGFTANGIIATSTDKDVFTFTLLQNSNFKLDVKPFSVATSSNGANLDVKVTLYNASKQVIKIFDPAATMNVSIDSILYAGKYYLMVEGTGNSNVDNYGSLGSYSISGLAGILPIRQVRLTGSTNQQNHLLNWDIIADESIYSIAVEASDNGIHFSELNILSGSSNNFKYSPFKRSDIYYRIKVTSVSGQSLYSNIVLLRSADKTNQLFTVSTIVTSQLTVNASADYKYQLTSINGKQIATGTGKQGFNKIDISRQPSGIYVLQLINNNNIQTERIIKQ